MFKSSGLGFEMLSLEDDPTKGTSVIPRFRKRKLEETNPQPMIKDEENVDVNEVAAFVFFTTAVCAAWNEQKQKPEPITESNKKARKNSFTVRPESPLPKEDRIQTPQQLQQTVVLPPIQTILQHTPEPARKVSPIASPLVAAPATSGPRLNVDDNVLSNFLKKILRHKYAWPFKEPVDSSLYPDYYQVIKNPMDFGIIQQRVSSGYYRSSIARFAEDIRTIFTNCSLYNPQESEIVMMAHKLQNYFDKQLNTLEHSETIPEFDNSSQNEMSSEYEEDSFDDDEESVGDDSYDEGFEGAEDFGGTDDQYGSTRHRANWTYEEDEYLKALITKYGRKWQKIASHFKDKSSMNCRNRARSIHIRTSEQGKVQKARRIWSTREDQLLSQLVQDLGEKDWNLIADKMGSYTRTAMQCRQRWTNHLCRAINKGPWTAEEDRIIVDAYKRLGNKWTQIAKLVPHRDYYSVRNRLRSCNIRKLLNKSGSGDDI